MARGMSVVPGDHVVNSIQIVGHAGLSIRGEGGSPTRTTLDGALEARVDRVELDVCASADGALLMLHDTSLPDGRLVGDIDLADLRRAGPDLLTIDEAVEHLAGRMPILLDLKSAHATYLLGAWFRGRRDAEGFAVCTENLPWLIQLRFAAPNVARWQSYPDIGERRTHHVQRVMAGLWRSHASLSGLRRGATDVQRAALLLPRAPQESLIRLGGLPWRERLPQDIRQASIDTSAAGLCVHHWVVSEQLIEQAHELSLHVNTWTVNNPFAARMVAQAGVDSITTDRVDLVRLALGSQLRPRPGAASTHSSGEGVRAAP